MTRTDSCGWNFPEPQAPPANKAEVNTHVGRCVTGVLLVQDLIVIPMLITLGFFGAERPTLGEFGLQLVGGTGLVLLVLWAHRRGGFHMLLARVFS